MTLHGFQALELISPGPCRPCDAARAGISIGEAAGFALLEREGSGLALLGAGASSDGHHMSSPHPEGAGAVAAMRQALDAAGLDPGEIDWINLHGTGTRANDATEDLAGHRRVRRQRAVQLHQGLDRAYARRLRHPRGGDGLRSASARGFVAGCLGVERAGPRVPRAGGDRDDASGRCGVCSATRSGSAASTAAWCSAAPH